LSGWRALDVFVVFYTTPCAGEDFQTSLAL
jgi:hypothetical protein